MSEKPNLNNMRAQADLDDARLDARKQKILENVQVSTGRGARATPDVNPSWLIPDPPKPAAPATAKARRSRRAAKPVVSNEEKWNQAMSDAAGSGEAD